MNNMRQYTYSIIIPHKNIPGLLQRCLDSIPQRDDTQIIIVDDNSDPNIVGFVNFPGLNRPNTEVYFDKTGRGAGRARNVGLKYAKGKWLMFIDADDYVSPNINNICDEFLENDSDIIYFRTESVNETNPNVTSNRADWFNSFIDEFIETEYENNLRLLFFPPWSKLYKRKLIFDNNISFDEIRYSNDNFFSVATGTSANKIQASKKCYYVVTENGNSLTTNFGRKEGELQSRAFGLIHAAEYAISKGYSMPEYMIIDYMRQVYKVDRQMYKRYFAYFRKSGYSTIEIFRKVFSDKSRFYRVINYIQSYILLL